MQPLDKQEPEFDLERQAKLIRRGRFFLDFLKVNRIMPPTEVAEPIAAAYARIVSFFAGDCGISKPKGFLLFGTTGCGKTTLVKAMRDCCREHMKRHPNKDGIIFIRARRLCEEYISDEYFLSRLREDTRKKTVIIDDLGTDRSVNRYGVPWGLEDYLEDRYDTWEEFGFPTLITTNYQTPKAVLERYGERAMSRLIGMVDFVAYNYHDRRVHGD